MNSGNPGTDQDPETVPDGRDGRLSPAGPDIASTTDPDIAAGRGPSSGPPQRPDETIVAETIGPGTAAGSRQGQAVGRPEHGRNIHDSDHRGRKEGGPPPPPRPGRSNLLRYAITGVVALACGAGGAWAYSRFAPSKEEAKSKGTDGSSKAASQADGGVGKPAGSKEPEPAPPPNAEALEKQYQNITSRFDEIEKRFNGMSMPRDINSPDVSSLRVRLDELSRPVAEAGQLTTRVRQLEDRIDGLTGELKALRDRDPIEKPATTPAPAVPDPMPSPPSDPNAPDQAMNDAIAAFNKQNYRQAEDGFLKLQAAKPKDARVWYFSALCRGLTSGDWDGEAKRLVETGADRERAGTPPASWIDASITGLTTTSGKDWLAAYRARLLNR